MGIKCWPCLWNTLKRSYVVKNKFVPYRFCRMSLTTVIKFLCVCLSLSSRIRLKSLRQMVTQVQGVMWAQTASYHRLNPSPHCIGWLILQSKKPEKKKKVCVWNCHIISMTLEALLVCNWINLKKKKKPFAVHKKRSWNLLIPTLKLQCLSLLASESVTRRCTGGMHMYCGKYFQIQHL